MEARLPTHLWVGALIRRVQAGGASAFVLQRGDEARGDVLVKLACMDGTAHAYVPSVILSGERVFMGLAQQGVGPDEAGVDAYVERARERDRDLWVIEIEDRKGRHFLTEPVEDQLQ